MTDTGKSRAISQGGRPGHRWFAALYDRLGAPRGLATRDHIAGGAAGRVLEVGCGTGLTFPHYGPRVTNLTATDPDPFMLKRARERSRKAAFPIELHLAPAEELPFEDASFDTVVSTWVLCSVGDQSRALSEVQRVLVPGGELRFAEHVRYGNPVGGLFQDVITPVWRWFGAGCHPNRNTALFIEEAGFRVVELRRDMVGPPPLRLSAIIGSAIADR